MARERVLGECRGEREEGTRKRLGFKREESAMREREREEEGDESSNDEVIKDSVNFLSCTECTHALVHRPHIIRPSSFRTLNQPSKIEEFEMARCTDTEMNRVH